MPLSWSELLQDGELLMGLTTQQQTDAARTVYEFWKPRTVLPIHALAFVGMRRW